MMKKYIIAAMAACMLSMSACDGFLDQEPDKIMTDDQIFGDAVMIKSVLANYYGRVTWGQHVADWGGLTVLDEAAYCNGGPDHRSTFEDDRWRVYDYTFIRNVNQFLSGLRATTVLKDSEKAPLEGEARFLRAWCYFNMCRGLGGMPIVGDEIFDYHADMDITAMQYPRSTEAELYDYIIKECQDVYSMLPAEKQINSARANKWTARMLEARAALYAASIANYNSKMVNPIHTEGGEVGIPASKADSYYQIALAAAEDVIKNSPYVLQDRRPDDKGLNFYEAVCVKDNNTEVIWARDYKYPGQTHGFTTQNAPKSHAEDIDNSYLGVVLNLVEDYELINTSTPGQKSLIETTENGTYKFYNSSSEPFKDRDPRLWGTVIYPGASFKGVEVVLQAGQLNRKNGEWVIQTGDLNSKDEHGNLITSQNGPKESNEQYINKTGFYVRKYLDETPSAGTRGRGSEMWMPRFRMAEAYLIAAEAAFELNNGKALEYINAVRNRAGVKLLTTLVFENIAHEKRVEFAFEDHRYWDMKRWRLADKIWNGNSNDSQARHRRLWPYKVVAPGDPNDGKWVFIEDFLFMSPNARYFKMQNYYNFLDLNWINNNPKLVKNPYQ
ncbi:MAG: RagB/SusD family nutrient uptake outer membrane protein [Massilibacteroides sp.]|nr:RagB/SusD family nutrient uptake outer membrane protein [Massilibacteroides sp.]MDD3062582.1 RagB/SusD family nutrient uptake outer membrane protein [Massilibacteroides sp.]MDD4115863.1 RagB/SusD family nutrient uptake outer membrane protein [Massilibacteroides sp.]MDD4660151.1 RagB/SusD family nutrient uptake outer membrane protein [Massilibacteroides sp.]